MRSRVGLQSVERTVEDSHILLQYAARSSCCRPDQRRRRRSRGQRASASSTPTTRPRRAGCDLVVFPELHDHRATRPKTSCCGPAFVAAGGRDARQARGAHRARAPRSSAFPSARSRPLQRGRGVRERRGARRVPQAAAAELRRVRRAALLRARRPSRPRCSTSRASRSACRSARTRGAPGPILAEAAGGAELDRQPQRVAVLRAAGSREREAMLAARAAEAGGADRLRESRRRPGRARVRRRVARRSTSTVSSSPGRSSSPRTCSSSTRRAPSAAPTACRRVRSRCAPHRRAGRPRRAALPVHEVYEALVLGTRDYVRKNGFADVLISLSGGIDSSLVAAIAVDALGAEHVDGRDDAVALLERRQRRRRRGARRRARHPHVHGADRTRARRVRGDARAGVRGRRARTSPRRTCRRVSAATW